MANRAYLESPYRVLVIVLVVLYTLGACSSRSNDSTGNDLDATLNRALADHAAGRLDDAKQGYTKVLAEDPDNQFALYNLGLIAQTEGDNVKAEDFYRRTLAVDPSFESALFNLAIVRTDQGDIDEAIELYERAIEVNPDSAGAHLNLGLLYLEIGKTPTRFNIPADVSTPSESRTSFAVKGTPCNKSTLSPLARDASATRASSIARSRITTTTELTAPLTASIRSMNAWTTSTDETTRSCRRCEMASAPFNQSSCMVETLTE